MKALTVRQPWSSLIALGIKPVENRSAGTSYRGPLAIHASLTYDAVGGRDRRVRRALGRLADPLVPADHFGHTYGHVIAVADLADVHVATDECCAVASAGTCAPWGERRTHSGGDVRHWVIANPRPLPALVPVRGALGLWDLDDTLLPTGVAP